MLDQCKIDVSYLEKELEEITSEYWVLLARWCPLTSMILAPTTKEKRRLAEIFIQHMHYLTTTDEQEIETNFIDQLLMAENFEIDSILLLKFLEKQIKIISECAGSTASQIKKCVFSMLTATGAGSRYRHFLSEIAVAAITLQASNGKLLEVESSLKSGKTADFKFEIDGKASYLEVFNIDFKIERLDTDQGLVDFISQRVKNKQLAKKISIETEDVTIFPVIWGDVEKVTGFSKALDLLFENNCFSNAFGPLVITPVSSDQGETWYYEMVPARGLRNIRNGI